MLEQLGNTLDHLDPYVNPDSFALQPERGLQRRRAAANPVEYDISKVGTRPDDPLQQLISGSCVRHATPRVPFATLSYWELFA